MNNMSENISSWKLRLNNTYGVLRFLELLANVADDNGWRNNTELFVGGDVLRIAAFNKEHTVLLIIKIKEYRRRPLKDGRYSIDIPSLKNALRRTNLDPNALEGTDEQVSINYIDEPKSFRVEKRDDKIYDRVEFNPAASFQMHVQDLQNILRGVSVLVGRNTKLVFEVSEGALTLSSKNDETVLTIKKLLPITAVAGEGKAIYNIRYIKPFATTLDKNTAFTAKFAPEKPLCFSLTTSSLEAEYYIAPFIP
ncbi:MAG: hypothetical protein QW069_08705 [Candidatus Caldarchaeum sp.]